MAPVGVIIRAKNYRTLASGEQRKRGGVGNVRWLKPAMVVVLRYEASILKALTLKRTSPARAGFALSKGRRVAAIMRHRECMTA